MGRDPLGSDKIELDGVVEIRVMHIVITYTTRGGSYLILGIFGCVKRGGRPTKHTQNKILIVLLLTLY